MKEKFGIELSESEVNSFLSKVLNLKRQSISIDFVNSIIVRVAEIIPFQNVEMTSKYFGVPLNGENLKRDVLECKGGICTTVNPFMGAFLNSLGYNVHLIACGKKNEDKRHVAICLKLNNLKYFIDFGDAQPYFEAIELNNLEVEYKRSFRSYKVYSTGIDCYRIELRKDRIWTPYFEFNTTPVNFSFFDAANLKFYSDLEFGPFWKQLHFGIYPNKKLIAIRGNNFIIEQEYGNFKNIKAKNENHFKELLIKHLPLHHEQFDFIKAKNRIYELNSIKKFGLSLTNDELIHFLNILGIDTYELTIEFLNSFIKRIFEKIPFQNINMLLRGKGKSPTVDEIKGDMLSGLGGPCGTMNPFVGSLLFKMGYEVNLVAGTMGKSNDHLALILNFDNEKYYIDCGDGQPYFQPMVINEEKEYYHPFKNVRLTKAENDKFLIQFFIDEQWSTDVCVDPTPRDFSFFEDSIKKHYTDLNYGPFWEGLRFACYPEGRIKAIRNKIIIIQDENNEIKKYSFEDKDNLVNLLNKYFKGYAHNFENAFLNITTNGNK
ncbi:MAG: arylamine N-acetyltransferase [Bacteroidota bacterium]